MKEVEEEKVKKAPKTRIIQEKVIVDKNGNE
jgi:hypothetical protein